MVVADRIKRTGLGQGSLDSLAGLLADLVESRGPKPEDYAGLSRLIRRVGDELRAGLVAQDVVRAWVREFTHRHFEGSMQEMALAKRFGYSGDFEIIDGIYTLRTSRDPDLQNWDHFFHSQEAPCAVRNRKAWFHQLLGRLCEESTERTLRVLNIGSGPAREVREWFLSSPAKDVFFDCVEMDPSAIEHAQRLCRPFLYHVQFHQRNILRFSPSQSYDLIWSAGLFDYLADRVFVRLLRALIAVVKPGGRIVIGNFSDFNPSRDYMEIFGDWRIIHRSRVDLMQLAVRAGADPLRTQVHWEPQGVNLFLELAVS